MPLQGRGSPPWFAEAGPMDRGQSQTVRPLCVAKGHAAALWACSKMVMADRKYEILRHQPAWRPRRESVITAKLN